MPCIEARGLRKAFGPSVALAGVDLRVEEGRILGLIGPNGAGKTTALNAILGLTSYEGELKVLGRDPWEEREQLMREVCFIADVAVLPRWMRVSQALDYVAATAANVLANESAFRIGIAGNLVATVCYLLATILVYELFTPVNRTLSLIAASFSALGCGLGALVSFLNCVRSRFSKAPPFWARSRSSNFRRSRSRPFNLANRANEVGLVFFGLHIGVVGYLIVVSGLVPGAIGVLLIIGGVCYDLNSFASFLAAPFARSLFPFILLPAFFAELAFIVWLLAKGVNASCLGGRASAAGENLSRSLT